jgi:hypothetical protein
MTNVSKTLKRLRRLSRPRRIVHLQALVKSKRPRSDRGVELLAVLKAEMTAQLRKEAKAA